MTSCFTVSSPHLASLCLTGEGFTTTALHHGHKLDTDNRARAPPIFQTTSFEFKSAEHGGQLFALAELGPIYTRLMNPTTHVLEYKVAKLEGAPCKADLDGPEHVWEGCDNAKSLPNALALSSGQSAQMHALLTIMQAGDNVSLQHTPAHRTCVVARQR